MGFLDRLRAAAGERRAVAIGIAVSAAWLVLVLLFWLLGPDAEAGSSGLMRLVAMVGVLMPLAMIWLAVGIAASIAALRDEADSLRVQMGQMRDGRRPQTPSHDDVPPMPRPARTAGATPPRTVPPPAAAPAPARSAPPMPARVQPAPGDARQSALRLESPPSVSVGPDDLVHALNFPDGPDDRRAIAALRAALQDHDAARVIRSAQDVVTLLAARDVYMDDLDPSPPDLVVWRRFAEGLRGEAIDAMGAVRDQVALEATAELTRTDEIFRDTAHHFMRHFDLALTRWVPNLSDAQLAALAETRSARAFMLLGRVAGIFG